MDDPDTTSLEQIRAFLAGRGEVQFTGQRREGVYLWVEQTLVRLRYASLDRPARAIFLPEFSFAANRFRVEKDGELELADHVVWVDDLLIAIQMKDLRSWEVRFPWRPFGSRGR